MNNSDIINYLVNRLYSNNNDETLSQELGDYIKQNKINVYTLYNILLGVFIKGIRVLNISILYNSQIDFMQLYFNKIKIKIHFTYCSKEDIDNNYSNFYSDRYYRANNFLMNNLILNGTHIYTNDLFNIRTFFSPYSNIHYCIQFSYIHF